VADLADALRALAGGRACVIPTDTVYGLAASLSAPSGVADLFRLKGRPRSKALPVLGADIDQLGAIVQLDERALRVARRFWPGPLTLVARRADGFDTDLGGEGTSVAVRVPAHDVALELLRSTGPLAVTSANRSGEAPVTTAAEARALFGGEVIVVDAGSCEGEPSTIVDSIERRVLREGALHPETVLQELMS
jgi:tRNA threonylcarbamoyl adenosine modification protein (Sua5/YciO/YrdC/YwlC family)